MNRRLLFNDGWEFAKSSLDQKDCTNLQFQPVDLPHDWLIYNTLDLYENSIGWYRRTFHYSGEDDQVLLYFEGVYMDSTLYVNGQYVGEWKYGYSSFEHDLTDFLKIGENEILLKVVHQSPNSRWYSGAGIYRNVWLKTRSKNHILTDGIYVSSKETSAGWQVEIETELSAVNDLVLTHTLFYQEQIVVSSAQQVTSQPETMVIDMQNFMVKDPLLWSPEQPNLYQLQTELQLTNGEVIESITQNIGFKTVILDPDQGFILNGTKMKLNGVCEHHDLGALGAAFNKTALKRRFKLLKEMGVNAIRTAHNMPAVELMELADEMGFLVVSEAFDMWERPKTKYDYARFFKEWAEKDVRSWVRRDRNHVSLIMWSIGNEIYDTHADQRGQEITRLLRDYVLQHDPKGNGKITIGSNYMPWENAQKCADILKIAGYNYAERYYHDHHEKYPDWIIYGSETASVVQSRGIYHFPCEKAILTDDDEQCSSLGNSTTSWGAKSHEACITDDRDAPFSLGQFIWTGFDYIGEPTPYHTKNSYFGQIDTATFKKDSFYLYQSAWTDYKTNPMVHIFPYWDFNEGQIIDVGVCSNAPKVELFLNGRSLGTFNLDHQRSKQIVGRWKVPYEKGELKAVAYDETGQIIATHISRSFGDAAKLCLKPDKTELLANGTDLIFVEITVADQEGNPVENANNRVQVRVSGAARLVGLDNGDSTDYDQYKGLSRRLFNGKLMAIVQATLEPGEITMEVSANGLETKTLHFQASAVDPQLTQGVSAIMANQELPCVMGHLAEIPVRKLEIVSPEGQTFTKEHQEKQLYVKLYPENTSYQEVEWSIVNDLGIPTNIAKIEADGHQAKVTALGDGEFRVRCTSKNGTDKVKLISELELKAENLGMTYKNPYEFISAGLYDDSQGEVGSGIERGITTGRDSETIIGFSGLDFGESGSDTITIPIFALTSGKYAIHIWEGMPNQPGSLLLADVVYQKPMKWNVYQAETYRLAKRLTGVTSLYFVFYDKLHFKGFSFAQQNRAFLLNFANQCDQIYGDTFTITEASVEGIGNNVSLEFRDFDFTEQGATKLIICGRAVIDNTIQVRFSSSVGEINQLIEFNQSNEYVEREFMIEQITGKQQVTFIFLPGSNFDFAWFKFKP